MELRNCKYICPKDSAENIGILENHWDSGFYSNHTQTFLSLLILAKHGIVPDKIDYSNGFNYFANKDEQGKDIYPDFCVINKEQDIDLYKEVFIPNENKKTFSQYNFEVYNKIVKRFFSPSNAILERKNILLQKYNLNPAETISVLYRGTDKWTEVRLAHPAKYLNLVIELFQQTTAKKVLLQTDQAQVINYFKSELGRSVIVFDENESTYGKKAINAVMRESEKSQVEWMQWFDASLRCVSDCAYLINHTGNCGLWANLYRGNVNNVLQFSEYGNLN